MIERLSPVEQGKQRSNSPLRSWLEQNGTELLYALRPIAFPLGTTPTEREEAARELLTSTALTALKNEDRFDVERSVKWWLLGIARRITLRHLSARKEARDRYISADAVVQHSGEATALWERLRFATPASNTNLAHATQDPAVRFVGQEWSNELISRLSPNDQEVVRLSIIEGLSGEEIARKLGVQPNTARTRLCRAMQRLVQLARSEEMQFFAATEIVGSGLLKRDSEIGGMA